MTIKSMNNIASIKKDNRIYKYWCQRYNLFSRFDDGIQMDFESWYSVTPENIARHIAERVQNAPENYVIVDAFCGVGGNLIQFALQSPLVRVIGIDVNADRLLMAKHNAKIYGVNHQCEFILGDFMNVMKSLNRQLIDVVFLSPPWGGLNYVNSEKYSLNSMTPNGFEIVRQCRKYLSNNISFLMPRNVDLAEVKNNLIDREHPIIEYENNMVGKKVKTITVYFGTLADSTVDTDDDYDNIEMVEEEKTTSDKESPTHLSHELVITHVGSTKVKA